MQKNATPLTKPLGFPRTANRYLDLSNEIRENELYKWENAMSFHKRYG